MHASKVVKKPMITEKATFGMNEHNRYAFEVDRHASKDQIRAAVEQLYKVQVEKVSTQLRKGERRRYRYGWVVGGSKKIATVRLKEGDTIELF